jgi:hypothetical protein
MARQRDSASTHPLSIPPVKSRRLWIVGPIAALGFLLLATGIRMRRVEYVSQVVGRPVAVHQEAEGWHPELILPSHHSESFEWLDQTHQMFDRGEWRIRHVDYENAPVGHDVFAASPYRWWLGCLAWWHHLATGASLDRAVERVALYADPLLLLILGAGGTLLVARRLGPAAAALLSLGLVALFPFSSAYLPATPDSPGLARLLALVGELFIVIGIREQGPGSGVDGARSRRWFVLAGVAGGLALWVSVPIGLPIVAGQALGGLFSAWAGRRRGRSVPDPVGPELPWRLWGLAGATTVLFGFLIEFYPSYVGAWEFRAVHPAYGLAWIGAAEVVARASAWIRGQGPKRIWRDLPAAVAGAAAVAVLPVAMRLNHTVGFLDVDLSTMRLSMLPGAESAPNFKAWVLQGGITPRVSATLLPVVLVGPSLWLLLRGRCERAGLLALGVLLGPVAVTLGLSCWQISWWSTFDVTLLGLLVATAAALGAGSHRTGAHVGLASAALALLLPGAILLWPPFGLQFKGDLTKAEAVGLLERDFASWLQRHVGSKDAIALAPPDATVALYYYGGIRGLGTLGWENRDGLTAAIRITSASTPEEAYALINRRGVTQIVIPRWDQYLDVYARLGEGQVEGTFLERLHEWHLPPWLQAVPYLIPSIAGFEGQSVTVFEVVDEQDEATAAGHLAAYFVDIGEMDLAGRVAQSLRRFPADPVAILARARVAIAQGNTDEFARLVELLQHRTADGSDSTLGWDDRVAYCIVLAEARHIDQARARLQRCLGDIDEEKLRLLSTNTLFRFELLIRALHLEIADPKVRTAALALLPDDLRIRLER